MLLDIICKYKTVSIVGMGKNCGKTVALNHIINEAMGKNLTLGLISTGRDGESKDLVTETEKPSIYVDEGTLVTTTTKLLPLSDATIEIMEVTDYSTSLGEVLIGRAVYGGHIQIAGPQSAIGIKDVSERLLKRGADMVLVDGAIDRKSSAAPSVSQAVILSTGAVVNRDMNRVIEETVHLVNLFNIPALEDSKVLSLTDDFLDKGKIAIVDESYRANMLQIKSALNSAKTIGENIKPDSRYVIIPGSLTSSMVEDMITYLNKYQVHIVVPDATKIFIPPQQWQRFMKMGMSIKVRNPINLVAITLNPYSPEGYYFNPEKFLTEMRSYIKNVPVVDLLLGGE
mgnify:CR=1 FL=1